MTTLQIINLAIMLAFFLCYSYQFFYIPVAWFKKDAPHREPSPHRIAVLIAARNEQSVIGNLIDSVKAQDYPTELVDVFVVADNCTDLTGSVAGAHGANVYFRNDQTQVGKGYALQYLLHCIEEDFAPYDGYLVLDADNVLSPDYITEINKTFSDGYQIVTSYRNSKNYGDNACREGATHTREHILQILNPLFDFRRGQNQFRPIMLKISPDMSDEVIDQITDVLLVE